MPNFLSELGFGRSFDDKFDDKVATASLSFGDGMTPLLAQASKLLLNRGLENVAAQGLWGTETACQVGLSGVYDLGKWRGAGIPNREEGKPALYP